MSKVGRPTKSEKGRMVNVTFRVIPETKDRLLAARRAGETWDDCLSRLLEVAHA